MKYKAGYKYVLYETITIQSPYRPLKDFLNVCGVYVDLLTDGTLVIRKGYAWDGPSGPTIDTKSFMRGSLMHDVSYQLIRLEILSTNKRGVADDWLIQICKEDGMTRFRRWYVHLFLNKFGYAAAKPENEPKVLEAP